MLRHFVIGLLLFTFALPMVSAQTAPRPGKQGTTAYPPRMEGAMTEVYKTIGDVKLNMYIFNPRNHAPTDKSPAIVFFFGGGWNSGSPKQFEPHCRYLAERGMVAMAADYRVASRHQVKAVDCVRDAKSALRWVRSHAARLGIDPNRIAAGGGSAGGHLAAAIAAIEKFDESTEDASISSVPNALVLFNPALVLAPTAGVPLGKVPDLSERMGVEAMQLSPFHQIKAGMPPTIIFHGKADTTVPYATAELFTEAMKKAGNRCELYGYEAETHGFFNFGRGGNKAFLETLKQADRFLASLGYLKGNPTVDTHTWQLSP